LTFSSTVAFELGGRRDVYQWRGRVRRWRELREHYLFIKKCGGGAPEYKEDGDEEHLGNSRPYLQEGWDKNKNIKNNHDLLEGLIWGGYKEFYDRSL